MKIYPLGNKAYIASQSSFRSDERDFFLEIRPDRHRWDAMSLTTKFWTDSGYSSVSWCNFYLYPIPSDWSLSVPQQLIRFPMDYLPRSSYFCSNHNLQVENSYKTCVELMNKQLKNQQSNWDCDAPTIQKRPQADPVDATVNPEREFESIAP